MAMELLMAKSRAEISGIMEDTAIKSCLCLCLVLVLANRLKLTRTVYIYKKDLTFISIHIVSYHHCIIIGCVSTFIIVIIISIVILVHLQVRVHHLVMLDTILNLDMLGFWRQANWFSLHWGHFLNIIFNCLV